MRWLFALPPVLLLACSSGYKIPQSHVNAPHASIGAAEQQGAATSPDASSRLNLAKSELHAADRLVKDGQKRSADLMYLRADADARLAAAIAQGETAVSDTQRIQREARDLEAQVRQCAQQGGGQP
jgi:hypothetical protein